MSLLSGRPGWKDNLLNCFGVAWKSLSLVAVACFLPGRAKDLSALRYIHVVSKNFVSNCLRRIILVIILNTLQISSYTFLAFSFFYAICTFYIVKVKISNLKFIKKYNLFFIFAIKPDDG